ncbi:urease accessory protein UreF [Kocuria turfanensis]|uniref:Urease accessory protein UreF n=1 Tax=Kocuria turfanensis TaxID=388357 RepID=A0A512IEG4_9MICC|nr:urease accessory UreF family protein [Kocuria turfanensis]GEO96096.1 urease accessory protein UreF [Kocuria turfanensis]
MPSTPTDPAVPAAAGMLAVLQLCDSALPTGAFAHSLGLETYLDDGTVGDEPGFLAWVRHCLHHQVVPAEGWAVRAVATAADDDAVWRADELLAAQALPVQVRDAASAMGRRMTEIGAENFTSPRLLAYADRQRAGTSRGSPAVAFALVGAGLGVPWEQLAGAYLFSTATSLTQNAVRGIPLGQNAGQRVLRALHEDVALGVERIGRMPEEEVGATSPGLEIAQMRHAWQRARMFMS